MEFMECSECSSKPGSPTLCPACLNNRKIIEKLQTRITEIEKELELNNQLLTDKDRLLHSIPECPVHGKECIPHAVEWVNRIKTLGEIIMSNKTLNLT